MMELFCEISKQLNAVNYFQKKIVITDVRLGSKYAFVTDTKWAKLATFK